MGLPLTNDRDAILTGAAIRLETVALPTWSTVTWSTGVVGAGKPSDGADVTTTILSASGTAIVMTASNLFKSSSGLGGVFIGSGGLLGKNTSGVQTFAINATTGAIALIGAISGASTLDITGTSRLGGAFTSDNGDQVSLEVNRGLTADCGVIGYAQSGGALNKAGIIGVGNGTNTHGVIGYSIGGAGNGVSGLVTTGTGLAVAGVSFAIGATGVAAMDTAGGTALAVSGTMTMTSTAVVTNLNSDRIDSKEATQFTQTVTTDSGTATAAAGALDFRCTITGYEFIGSSNDVTLQPVSDRRLKQDIAPETLGLAFIMKLKPVSYRMISEPTRKHHGFIAQDLKELFDGLGDALHVVSPNGVEGTDYLSYIGPLVKSIQELWTEVQELKGRLKNERPN